MVVRAAVILVARAHRRCGRLDAGRGRIGRDRVGRHRLEGHHPRRPVADRRRRGRRERRVDRLPADPELRGGTRRAVVPLGAGGLLLDGRARARHERRAEDDGRHLPRADRQRLAPGRRGLPRPEWVVVSCATAIALGTYTGGWRIIKTLGTKVVEVRPPQGFGSETVAATVILASSHVGYPLSTTQVVSGAVPAGGRAPGRRRRLGERATSSSGGCSRCPRGRRGAVVLRDQDVFGDGAAGPIVVTS